MDDGSRPALFAAGGDTIQKWDGQTWTRYLPQPGPVSAIEIYDGPAGPMLHAGGSIAFGSFPNQLFTNIARFTPDGAGGGLACGDFDGDGVVTRRTSASCSPRSTTAPDPTAPATPTATASWTSRTWASCWRTSARSADEAVVASGNE